MKKLFLLLVICSVLISSSVVFAVDYNDTVTFEDDLIFSNDESIDDYYEDNSKTFSTYYYDDYVDESIEDYSQYEKYWNDNSSNYINNNKNHSNNHINQQKLYKYNDTLIFNLNDNKIILNNSILKNISGSINLSKDNNIEIQNMGEVNENSFIDLNEETNMINNRDSTILNTISVTPEVLNDLSQIKTYVDTYHEFPEIIINNETISQSTLLYILCNFVLNETSFNIQEFPSVKSYILTDCYNSSMNKTQYINFANNIINFYSGYGRPPANVLSDIGRITFEDTLYFYLNIVDYYNNYNEFPESQSVQEYLNIYNVTVNNFQQLKNLLTMGFNDYNFMIITINENFSWNELIFVNSSIKRIYIQCNLTSPIQCNHNLLMVGVGYDIVVNNLQIIQNWVEDWLIENNGNLSIVNSTFKGIASSYSWMIYNYGDFFFYNSKIIYNESLIGGILVNQGNVNIQSCQFINNYIRYGIFFNYQAIMNIFNSTISHNILNNSIFKNIQSNLTITDCTIFNNSISFFPANFLDNSAGNVTLYENLIYSNQLYGENFINNKGTLILRENIISNQTIPYTTLINSVEGNVLLYGNDFNDLSNSQMPLLLYNNRSSTANLFYNYVSNNFANSSKLIYNQGSINLSHNYFENNSASTTIYVEDGNVSFASNNFFNNYAETGGVIYIGGGMVNVSSNNFHNNSVNNSGGVIVNDRGNLLSKSNTYFNNSAGKGAAIYTTNSTTVLINDTLKYNKALLGSAILSENNSILLIQNTTISNNTAINKGAAIYSNHSIISINDSNIYNNFGEYGAGLSIYNNSVLRLTNVLLTNNNATYSGGALYSNNSAVLIYDSRLIKNNALSGVGGCLSCVETSLTINNSNFTRNTAHYGGAIAQLSQKFTTIDDSLFTNNNATIDGGALYFVYGLININSTKFSNNIATNKAGAIYTRYVSIISCDYSLFDVNNDAINGSVLYSYKSSLMFENNIIISGEKNLIYINNSTYDLNSNWWGLNNPNFHIITNNITPDNWRVLHISVNKTNSIKQLNISINILSDGSITTENILSRAIVVLYNSSSDIHYIEDNISFSVNSSVGNMSILMDNQQINVDNQIDSYITIKDVYAKVNENISFIIHTNAKNGKFVIKINGKTIKDETGRVIYAKNINGTCIFNYTIPNNFSKEIYNISTVYSGSSSYKSARINSSLYIHQLPNYLSIEDTVTSNKIEPSLKMDSRIVTPGTSNIIEAWMDDDINDDVQISVDGQIDNVSVSSGHILCNYMATNENYKLINLTIHFDGNHKYLSKTWTLHLYSQYDEQEFDMRNYGLVTPIKNQYNSSACWAFASIGTLESAILNKYNVSMDFSENYLKNSANKYSLNSINNEINQGNSLLGAINLLISGKSLVYEEEDPFDSESIISAELQNKFQVNDVIFMKYTQDLSQINTIKSMILNYGAVFTDCYTEYDNITNLFSYNNANLPTHAIMLVGWDDNYSKYYFNDNGLMPEGDGAFIVKNSWGDDKGVNGYYYISYYDKSIGTNTTGFNIFAFDLSNEDNYTNIYQSESMSTFSLSKNESNTLWIKNNYHAENYEAIKAVGTYFFNKTSYQMYIYKNDHLMSTQEGTVDYVGYHTIKLNTLVYLQQNDNFTIMMKLNTSDTCNIFIQDCNNTIFDSEPKKSYVSINGLEWMDLYQINAIASLKVYTTSDNNEFQITTTVTSNKVKLQINNLPVTKYNLTYTVNNRLIGVYNITSQRTFYANLEENETENILVKIQYNTKNYNYTKINLLYPKNVENIRNITIPNFIYDNEEFDNTHFNRINYTTIIPCYVNVTLPNVIEVENDPYNIYIQKPGENGTVIIPMQRLINVTVANNTYTFSNVQDNNTEYILKQASYFIPLNGSQIIQCTQTYTPDNNGILIMYNNYNIILKYYYNLKNPINQFAAISNTTIQENYNQRVPRNNQTMYVELVRYNLNGITTATIRYTEGMLYDQHGIKHQLYIQGIIQSPDDTYNYQENGICYTNTNELLLYNASNDKIIREDYSQNITSIFTCDNSSVTRNEIFTFGNYGITNTLQSYTIVKSLINETLFTEWINKEYPNATTIMKNMFLIGLETFYLNDEYCNIISKITNTTYNRTFNTIIMTGLNNDTAYIHSPDSLMGITVEGDNEDNNTITFRLFTTIALPSIETNVLNSMAQVSSPITHLLEAIENEDYFLIEEENNLIIISNDLQSILKLNTETGVVVDYLNINANTYHGLITNDSSKTSLFHFDVDSPEAQAQNLAGQILMNVGSYVVDVPVAGWIPGLAIFAAGAVICADANGCFSMDETNMSRVSKTCVDIGTNIPFLKVGSLISSKLAGVGIVDKISEGVGHLAEHSQYFYDAFESGANAVITFVGEFFTNTENQTIESIVIDSVFNSIPLRTYSKTFSEYPYRLGSMIKKVSKDSDNYVKNMFKMLDRYDKELKIFGEEVGDLLRASVFVTFNTFETTGNVLCNNYIYDVFKMIFDTKNSTFLSELMGFGFNITSRDSSYVAITQVKR